MLGRTEEVEELIGITKSDSGVSGPLLARAHMRLGELLADKMDFDPDDTTVVAILRGGMFFAEGIYFGLGCQFQVYDPKQGNYIRPATTNVVIADSVVNTGASVRHLLDEGTYLACCVVNKKAVPEFEDKLFAVRVSDNNFVGCAVKFQAGNKGPDTTMRLFNLI